MDGRGRAGDEEREGLRLRPRAGHGEEAVKAYLPPLAFTACGLIWGTTFLVIRVGNETLPPLWACSLRFVVAGLVLNAILFARGLRWPKGPQFAAAVWYGILEFGIGMPLLYWGERVVNSGLAAVLYAICPITAMFAARLLGMERLNPWRLGAAALGVAGVAIIFWREVAHGSSSPALVSILIAACVAPIAGLLLQRAPRQDAIGANAVGVVVALPFALAASCALGEAHPLPLAMSQWFPVVYLALAGSVGAFVIFAWLIHHWRATSAAFLGVIVPVIAVLVGAIARGEALAPGSVAGATIVIIGVSLALRTETAIRP